MFINGLKINWFRQTLKELFICIVIIIAFSILIAIFSGCVSPQIDTSKMVTETGQELKNSDCLQMYYKMDFVGQLTVKEFKTLLDSSENYSNLLKAENNQTVKIELETSPWEIKSTDNTFETFANIIWYNDKGTALKKIRFRIRLNKNNDSWTVSKIDSLYTKASRVMFPTMSVVSIVLFLLLIILL